MCRYPKFNDGVIWRVKTRTVLPVISSKGSIRCNREWCKESANDSDHWRISNVNVEGLPMMQMMQSSKNLSSLGLKVEQLKSGFRSII